MDLAEHQELRVSDYRSFYGQNGGHRGQDVITQEHH